LIDGQDSCRPGCAHFGHVEFDSRADFRPNGFDPSERSGEHNGQPLAAGFDHFQRKLSPSGRIRLGHSTL
jgi:hypothetical protein